MKSVKVKGFYGDVSFDVNELFTLLHITCTDAIIKIRKNASTGRAWELNNGDRQ